MIQHFTHKDISRKGMLICSVQFKKELEKYDII